MPLQTTFFCFSVYCNILTFISITVDSWNLCGHFMLLVTF